MSLVNCKVSPVAFLLLISEGMTCKDCKLKRKFEQVGIKAIKTAQDEDPLICTVCEGVRNVWEHASNSDKPLSANGEWIQSIQKMNAESCIEFRAKLLPNERQHYDSDVRMDEVVMRRGAEESTTDQANKGEQIPRPKRKQQGKDWILRIRSLAGWR